MRSSLIPSSNSIYYANFSVGTPPVPQLAVMATGSSLLWIKCLPCQPCSPTPQTPLYDPNKSSTYAPKMCDSYCVCQGFDQCAFNKSYAGAPRAEGTYGTELVRFTAWHDAQKNLDKVVFGCCRKTQDLPGESLMTGVLGLGTGSESILNRLEIGEGATLQGVWTTYVTEFGLYYVTVERMSFDGLTLDIPSSAFVKTPAFDTGVILDSGAQMTFLNKAAYYEVERTIVSYMEGSQWKRVWPELAEHVVCYGGKLSEVAVWLPVLGIHFAGGAELSIDAYGTFMQLADQDAFCLAFGAADSTQSGSIGILAQQNYNVGYDLVHKRVYFQRSACLNLP
ncbi:unnamed protein product [Linum tenue]|uniref:Peptidase A1 domain-containing protein n=1 Tax=Linum tenue TaxID=586396 RepID=A0AAV0IDZ0_9ROSI|nr:unnamed protein product [Linum tenue]